MKTNIKNGISLIVLVITIIVMIILAATIIISLNNVGIIGAAENAVCMTNIKQAQNLAVLTWSNMYTNPDDYNMDNIEDKLRDEFEANGLKYEDYNVEITKNGIDISSKEGCVDSSGVESGATSDSIAKNWSYAYIYDGTTWSIKSEYDGTEPTGTIVMKAYENGTIQSPVDEDETVFETKTTYKMVVTGEGAIEGFNDFEDRKLDVLWGEECFAEVYVKELVIGEGITAIGKRTFGYFYNCETVSLPSTLTTIGEYAFNDCGVKSLVIPDSVTQIGAWAFYDCFNLENLKLSNNLVTINNRVFESAISLKNVVIPDSVTSIKERAFAHSEHFDTIVVPAGLKEFGYATFENCTINKIYFKGSKEEWDAITNLSDARIPADTVIEYNYTGN